MHTGLTDNHPGKRMPDQNRRAILPRQHPLGRSDRFRQRRERVLHGRGIEPRRLQSRNHFGPARSVSKSPCTSTTLRAFVAFAAMPRGEINEAAAPATMAAEKARLFI